MSRKTINIFFIIGSSLYIPGIVLLLWGYINFIVNIAQNSSQSEYGSSAATNGLGTFMFFIIVGAILTSIGSIAILVARIGALIEIAKAQEWVWFVLLILFGWIVLLIYLLTGTRLRSARRDGPYPYSYAAPAQPWQNYQSQAPGVMQHPDQPWAAPQQNMPSWPQE